MRTIAILVNLGFIGVVSYELVKNGLPKGGELLIVLFVVVAPILNLIVLLSSRDGKGWLTLFLKRKALEEQRKIEDLKKKDAA
jgi:hypothetical protein